jgi:hypothetical protein
MSTKGVQIWFWDGAREYSGEAVELSAAAVTALLKMSQFGDATVVPTQRLLEGLVKHLTQRVVEMKVSGEGMEATSKTRITEVQVDFANPRRILLLASFQSPSERSAAVLAKLASRVRPS